MSLSESAKAAWWNWISPGHNDRISILTPLGVCIGLQWMLAGFATLSIRSTAPKWDQLTQAGKTWYRPDRDLAFYVLGSCFAVLMTIMLERNWRRSRERPRNKAPIVPGFRVAILLALVPTSLVWLELVFHNSLLLAHGVTRSSRVIMLFQGIVAAVALFLVHRRPSWAERWGVICARDVAPPDEKRWADDSARDSPVTSTGRIGRLCFDAGMMGFIASLIYVNNWGLVSYQSYRADGFLHWDFFCMGPALGYSHGRALGTDVYSQYGFGWPVLFAWLSTVTPVNYSTCAGAFVLCGTIYFSLYYLTLRHVTANALLAAAMFFAMLNLQLFHGVATGLTIWTWPSSSIVRSVFDIGFFFMLAVHGRSGQSRWLIASAAVVGLSLLFEIDTGLYLLASLFYYLFVTWLQADCSAQGSWSANVDTRTIAASTFALLLVTGSGFFIASRGTLFSTEFIENWLEGILVHSNGFSSLPMSKSGALALAMFVVMTGLAICAILVPILRRRPGRRGFLDRYLACWGAYAWCSMVLFVNRSYPWNIFHCILPFGVLAAHFAGSILDRSQEIAAGLSRSGSAAWLIALVYRGAPGLALLLALAAFWANPVFRRYPNCWNGSTRPRPLGNELCLMPGVCGFPATAASEIEEFQAVTAVMAECRKSGHSVEIIHPSDPKFYLASGCSPLDRYSPLLPFLLTKPQLAQALDRFKQRKTSRILIQKEIDSELDFHEAWLAYRDVLPADYEIEKRIGGFEVWRLRGSR